MRVLRSSLVLGSALVMGVGALMLAVGLTATTAATSGRPTVAASRRPSVRFLAEARSALVRYLRHDHPQVELVHPGVASSAPGGTSLTGSYNWSGYADVSTAKGTFTKVSGRWTTPRVTCSSEDTVTSEWVGIDGWNDGTVEQDGTLDWCFESKAIYFTWYEMYPAGTVEVGTSLQPGDKITAKVTRAGTAYTLSLTDSTHTANSFSKTATCAAATCLDTSAEWIAERPSFSIGIAPLADYASWTLSGATETASGKSGTISSFASNDEVEMVDATHQYELSEPSDLTGGNSFTTTWRNSY